MRVMAPFSMWKSEQNKKENPKSRCVLAIPKWTWNEQTLPEEPTQQMAQHPPGSGTSSNRKGGKGRIQPTMVMWAGDGNMQMWGSRGGFSGTGLDDL